MSAPAGNGDDGSVVLRLEYGKLRYLFAGDIDKREEAILLQSKVLPPGRRAEGPAPRQRERE